MSSRSDIPSSPCGDLRVFLTGGGTGGHVFPNIAFMDYIKEKYEVKKIYYLGLKDKPEGRIINKEGYEDYRFLPICSHQFPRSKRPLQWILFSGSILLGILYSLFYTLLYRPHIIISSGGYVSVPVLLLSGLYRYICRILLIRPPTIISIEPNADPGVANATFGLLSDKIFISFDETGRSYGSKAIKTGYPVRSEIKKIRDLSKEEKSEIRKKLNIPHNKKLILITGGSQGARNINALIASSINDLASGPMRFEIMIIHSTGLYHDNNYDAYDFTIEKIKQAGFTLEEISDFYRPFRFLDNITEYLSVCDLAVARGGAGSLFEMQNAGVPCIFVPKIEIAGEHQLKNCREVYRKGLGAILYEYREQVKEGETEIIISKDKFMDLIEDFFYDRGQFAALKKNLKEYSPIDTKKLSMDCLKSVFDENEKKFKKSREIHLSILNKYLLCIALFIYIFLHYDKVPLWTSPGIMTAFLLYLSLYFIRGNAFFSGNSGRKLFDTSYIAGALLILVFPCILLIISAFNDLSLTLLLIALILVNNLLRKFISRRETDIAFLPFLIYLIVFSNLFHKYYSEDYFYMMLFLYLILSNIYFFSIFIINGMSLSKHRPQKREALFILDVLLFSAFIIYNLFYVHSYLEHFYLPIIMSFLIIAPLLNIMLNMVKRKFIEDPANIRQGLGVFFRGILFYTLPVIILLIVLENEILFFIENILYLHFFSPVLPVLAMISPLVVLLPLMFMIIRLQNLKGTVPSVMPLAIIVIMDLVLKVSLLPDVHFLLYSFSLYLTLFIVLSLRFNNKVSGINLSENHSRIIEIAKLLILFSMFILSMVCFKFDEINNIWALIVPLSVSLLSFFMFSRILGIKGQSNITEDIIEQDDNDMLRRIESYPPLKFSLTSPDILKQFDTEYLVLRLNSFKYSSSWWSVNCGVRLIGNMKKEDEISYLLDLIKTREKNTGILKKLLAGDYKFNAIIRRNALGSIISIGKFDNMVREAILCGLKDKHFEVRAFALKAIRKFRPHICHDFIDMSRNLTKDRYIMVSAEALKTLGAIAFEREDLDILLNKTDLFDWKIRNAAIEGIISFLQSNPSKDHREMVLDRLENVLLITHEYKPVFPVKENYKKLLKILET